MHLNLFSEGQEYNFQQSRAPLAGDRDSSIRAGAVTGSSHDSIRVSKESSSGTPS